MGNAISDKIASIIKPILGEFMARGTVALSCRKLNLNVNTIDETHLESIANEIEVLMTSKLGPEGAKGIKDRILLL